MYCGYGTVIIIIGSHQQQQQCVDTQDEVKDVASYLCIENCLAFLVVRVGIIWMPFLFNSTTRNKHLRCIYAVGCSAYAFHYYRNIHTTRCMCICMHTIDVIFIRVLMVACWAKWRTAQSEFLVCNIFGRVDYYYIVDVLCAHKRSNTKSLVQNILKRHMQINETMKPQLRKQIE